MAGGKKKKAADRKKADTGGQAESDRRLQYQTATTNAMQQASSRAMQAHETQLDQPNPYVQALQSRPDQHVQSQQTDRAIKKENGDDSGDSVSHQNPETDEESEWEDEEQEEGAPHPKARPNRKNRGLVRWSDDVDIHLLLCMTYICQKEKVKIPWKNIAKKMSEQVPHTTPGAISQHLSKVRLSRRGGSLEPPSPIRKSKKASATTGGGSSSTERSETMTPKQVNKKTNKRAREATPDAPQKRKHVKKAFVDTKPASKGTPRRAGNTNDSNEDTGETTESAVRSNIVRLRIPSLAAGNTEPHPVIGNGPARIPASQYYGSSYYDGHDFGNDSLLNQHVTPGSINSMHLGLNPPVWSPHTSHATFENPYPIEHAYDPADGFAAALTPQSPWIGYGMIPWELSPGQPLGPNAWLPYVAQRDAPHMSGQEMALCAEDEITAMLGPRPPTVRAAEEITWKQEEDDLSPVLSPRQCKWFVSEEENLE